MKQLEKSEQHILKTIPLYTGFFYTFTSRQFFEYETNIHQQKTKSTKIQANHSVDRNVDC